MKRYLLIEIIVGCMLVVTLNRCTPTKLEKALELSGKNRGQLEKVLQHYSSPTDSLKLEAARFLIENMPGHYTLRGTQIDYCREAIDKDTLNTYHTKKLYDIILDFFISQERNARREDDLTHITADYLIRHIDATFELAEKQGILDLIPLDIFFEEVLPYRFRYERLDLWRDSLQVVCLHKPLGELPFSFANLRSNFKFTTSTDDGFAFICNLLQEKITDDCFFIAYNALWKYRSLGLPQTVDCIPFYSNRNGYHYWNVNPSILHKETDISGAVDRRSGKIYRHTFSHNPAITPFGDEFVPELFKDVFLQDVTDSYYHTANVSIENNTQESPRHAYLCVFNNLQWKPIAAGKVSNNTAEFKRLAKNIVYFPVCYTSAGTPLPFNYPFILDIKGNIKYLIPDKHKKQTLRLERKNPDVRNVLFSYMESLNGIVIEASNDKKFSQTDTVFVLKEANKLYYKVNSMQSSKKYRWYRVKPIGYSTIAELYFINPDGEILHGKTEQQQQAIIDGNPLTNVVFHDYILIDFATPVEINTLVCLPRNDGNGVYPKNIYELFYFGPEGWVSMGKQEGDEFYVEYDNLPAKALYWLHNLTTGVEERIFTYSEGEITFW